MRPGHLQAKSPRAQWARSAIIFILTLVVYSPVLAPDTRFLWDDDRELWGIRSHLVQESDGIAQAWLPIRKPEAGWLHFSDWQPVQGLGFWPLTPTVFWLQWRIWGADERWAEQTTAQARVAAVEAIANRFHLPGILLHAGSAALIFLILARLGVPGAWLVGLVFALHPMNVPSVAWVSELKNSLSLFLLLVSLYCFLRFDQRPAPGLLFGALATFFLSLTAKTAGVGFPFVLLGMAWWRRGKIVGKDVLRILPFFAVSLFMGLTTLWFTRNNTAAGVGEYAVLPEGFLHSLAQSGWIPFFYAWKTVLPVDLMMIYPRLEVPWRNPLAYLPGLLLLGVALITLRKSEVLGRGPFLALLVMMMMLFPVLGFFGMTYMMHSQVSDHFHYISIIPLLALLIGGGARFADLHATWQRPALALATAIVILLGLATYQRSVLYKSNFALFTDNVARNPDAWMAHYNLGSVLVMEAAAMAPGALREEKTQLAKTHLLTAEALQPDYQYSAFRLGMAHSQLGEKRAAMQAWRRAIAITQEKAQQGHPAELWSWRELARAHARDAHWAASRAAYESLLARAPERQQARFELSKVLVQVGDEMAAMQVLEELVKRNPNQLRVRITLSILLATSPDPMVRDGDAALRHARHAERLPPSGAAPRLRLLHALAAAEAERAASGLANQREAFEHAAQLMEEALDLARRSGSEAEIKLAELRRGLYLSGRPARRVRDSATDS